MTAKHSSI